MEDVVALFRWGVFGTGPVANKFVLGLRHAQDAAAVVVASRTQATAQRFARHLGIDRVAEGYDAAIAAGQVDAFYIATPPTTHAELAIKCLDAGIPVLVEKPLAANAAEARLVRDVAAANGVFCMEAMWTRFLPAVVELKRLVDSGELGQLRGFTGGFCAPMRVDREASIFRADLGGGALLHRGIYPLSLASHLMGVPVDARGMTIVGQTGVDEDAVVMAQHPGQAISVSHSSLRTAGPNDCWVMGESGVAHIHGPVYRPFRVSIARTRQADASSQMSAKAAWREGPIPQSLNQLRDRVLGDPLSRHLKSFTLRYRGNGYHYQADAVGRAVRAGELHSAVMPLDESVELLSCIDRVRSSTG